MILCYHKIHPVNKSIWWIPVDTFYKQMASIRSRKVVFLNDYDPENPDHIVITFDGIYDNVHQYAAPILEYFNYPYELFVIGDYIGRENTFDQTVEPPCMFANMDMLTDMEGRGGRVQWHTRTHRRFSTMTPLEAAAELVVPEKLRSAFGPASLKWFAYPHGEIGENHREVVRKSFAGALACDDGDSHDLFNLPRTLVFKEHSFFKGTVAAIVPNYNYGRFLNEAIDSLERQTVKPDEILIIDDASTDDSPAVLDQLQSRGYRVERNHQNLGIVENFRKAVALTNCDYVFFLGADNRLRSDFVLETRLALDQDPSAAIAYTDLLIFGPLSGELAKSVGAEKIGRSIIENWDIYHWKQPAPTEEALRDFKTHNFVHGSSMYRRSHYEAVGGYKRTDSPEDHNLFFRIWEAGGGLSHVAMPVIEYRQHSPAQANTIIGLQTEIKALRNELSWMRKESEKYIKSLEAQIARHESVIADTGFYQAGLEAQVAAANRELAQAGPYQASLEAQIARLESVIAGMGSYQATLEAQVAASNSELAQAGPYQASLEAQISRVASELEGARLYQSVLEAQIAGSSHELALAGPYQASLEAQLTAIRAELAKAASYIGNLETQIMKVTDRV